MLVLTRKRGEQIVLGDDIVITVIRIKGQTIRLGIEAPRELPVVRGELERHEQPRGELPATRPCPAPPSRVTGRRPADGAYRSPEAGSSAPTPPLAERLRGIRGRSSRLSGTANPAQSLTSALPPIIGSSK